MLQGLVVLFLILCPASATFPAILIPGDGASALEISYKDISPPHWWCSKSSGGDNEWERLWIPNLSQLLPKNIDCWSQKMMLHYDTTNVSNAPGVRGIRAIPGSKGLEIQKHKPSNYQPLFDALPQLQVATYDFRLSPRGNPKFVKDLQNMIETAFHDNNNTRVLLISHSLGGLLVHYFLTSYASSEWKDQYIQGWIPIAPAYGGTKYTLKQLISGDSAKIPLLHGKDVKDEQRSYETSVWLLPNPSFYSSSSANVDPFVVSTLEKNYTVNNYHELFQDAGFDNFQLQWDRIKDLTRWDNSDTKKQQQQLADPNVTVYPVYGNGVDTVEQLVYKSTRTLDQEPIKEITSPFGDGTVNLHSLQAGNQWKLAHKPLELDGVSHAGIRGNAQAIHYIQDIVHMEGIAEKKDPPFLRTN